MADQRGIGQRGRGLATIRGKGALAGTDEFHGRASELDRLRRALERLGRGKPARLLILGDPGIGKSRLLAEAVSTVSPARVAVLSARALEVEMDRPFGLLADAIDLHADSADRERAAMGRLVIRARDPASAERRHNLVHHIVEFVDSLCDHGPLALLLEDVQWADPQSASAVGAILEALPDRPLGVILTSRRWPSNPVVDDLLERAGGEVERIELDALPPDAINAVMRGLTGGDPGPRLAALVAGSGGNPGLVISLMDGLLRERALTVSDETTDTDATEPPQSMHPPVMARIARLSERCQDLLTVAAVLGEPFAAATLATAAGRSVIDVLGDLRQAMAAGIIAQVGGVLCFRHELVREILYEETPASVRSVLHLRIGNSLRTAGGDATAVGFHLMRGRSLAGRPPGPGQGIDAVVPGALPGWETLTRAERAVVRHVVEGLSNREIGERLFVSARTVETHLAHVFAKLGVSSRVELTGVVVRAEDVRDRPVDQTSQGPIGSREPI